MNWTLRMLGETVARGTADTKEECQRQAREALKKRQDYGSIIALGDLTCLDLQITQ